MDRKEVQPWRRLDSVPHGCIPPARSRLTWHHRGVDEQRWAELVQGSVGGPVTPGTMFGSKGLRTGTKFFAIWRHEQLVVKLPSTQIDKLVSARAGEPFEPMAGRAMNGWVVLAATADWSALAAEARSYVESLQR